MRRARRDLPSATLWYPAMAQESQVFWVQVRIREEAEGSAEEPGGGGRGRAPGGVSNPCERRRWWGRRERVRAGRSREEGDANEIELRESPTWVVFSCWRGDPEAGWVVDADGGARVSEEDLAALAALQGGFSKCVDANGLGLQAVGGEDYCRVVIQYPSDTVSKWKDPKTGESEGLSFEFNLCEAVASWEQVRNSTTILTKEYIDALPNGWEEYAWRRINKGILLNKCRNRTLCMEKLSLVLPETSPYVPQQFGRCAVVGNSGDLLKTKFGDEIDSYDVVIRENGAPIQNYTEYVGKKSTFRLLNRGSAKALDKVVELDETKKEALIVKTTIHDIMNKMIRELPITNPVYLMLGTSFGSSAKGTGLKALEFALSICDSVDMYGFTVDPGYKEWTRYFSESRKGHTPLHGRAYYQMMECLGLVKIHSPMRGDPGRVVKWLPTKDTIEAARVASEKLLKRPGAGTDGPLSTCTMIKKRRKGKAPSRSGLRDAAMNHLGYMKGATRYPLERYARGGYLCMIDDR